jgi:pimeloyl-ACP methyl ester carboxylesterase
MSLSPNVLWLSASPSLQCFDRPLLNFLFGQVDIVHWQYFQEKDEGSSLDMAVELLHEYLTLSCNSVHLVGHGISGVIGLLYARRYPEQVRSLTLLAVAAQPALTWHTHYYVQRHLSHCSRYQLLATQVKRLFGARSPYPAKDLVRALARDLEEAPCLHSLFKLVDLPKGGVLVPLMVCSSKDDPVVHSSTLNEWQNWTKPEDIFWECPSGHHFFHYYHPRQVGENMLQFWQKNSPILHPSRSLNFESEKSYFSQCKH